MNDKRLVFNGKELGVPIIRSIGFHNFNHTTKLETHMHDGMEVTFVLKGAASWIVQGKQKFKQPGNTLFFMPQNLKHQGENQIIPPCWLFWFILDKQAQDLFFSSEERKKIFNHFEYAALKTLLCPPRLTNYFTRLFALFRQQPCPATEIRLIIYLILLEITNLIEFPKHSKTSLSSRAENYIAKNLYRPLKVDEVAAACGLSESGFARQFRLEAGLTPSDFILRQKIEHAKSLLQNSQKTITDIAFDLGFSSSQYFSTVFKRYSGCSPSRYRK